MSDLPEFAGSRLARERAAEVTDGALTLQRCVACGGVQYPFRELCGNCLSDELRWSPVERSGVVIATAAIHASLHDYFREHAPWQICSVALDAGPRVIAHARGEAIESGDEVEVSDERVSSTHCVLVARLKRRTPPSTEER